MLLLLLVAVVVVVNVLAVTVHRYGNSGDGGGGAARSDRMGMVMVSVVCGSGSCGGSPVESSGGFFLFPTSHLDLLLVLISSAAISFLVIWGRVLVRWCLQR